MIIIGTGAGGGTLAYSLAATGKNVLLLERGTWLPREKENWDVGEVFINERYHATEMWHDKHGKAFRPHTNYNVGGNTKVYGSILFHFREKDFTEVRHYDGISPAWPISYADLAPYYTRAEHLYAVHGQRGSDPTEPLSTDAYPWPAMSHEPRIQEVNAGLRRQGIQTFPLPVGIQLDEDHPESSTCIRCNTFDGFPCLLNGQADAATSVLDVNCKAHDLDNLYVVDASVFPSSSSVNPALTIMANALRVGEHLTTRLGATPQPGVAHAEQPVRAETRAGQPATTA